MLALSSNTHWSVRDQEVSHSRHVTDHRNGAEFKRRESRIEISDRIAQAVTQEFSRYQLQKDQSFLPDENENIFESKNIEALMFLCGIELHDKKLPFDEIHKSPLKKAHATAQRAYNGFYRWAYPVGFFIAACSVANFFMPNIVQYFTGISDNTNPNQVTANALSNFANSGISFAAGVVLTGTWPDSSQTAANYKNIAINEIIQRYESIGTGLKELRAIKPDLAKRIAGIIKAKLPILTAKFQKFGLSSKDVKSRSKTDHSEIGRILSPLEKAVDYVMKEHLSSEEIWQHLSKEKLVEIVKGHEERLARIEHLITSTRQVA